MPVCGVLRSVLSVSFSAIVIFLLQNFNVLKVQASLPPGAEDEIIVIEHLPGRRVHLQDFFWTDAEDAPSWIDLNRAFHDTRTILRTVTLYLPVEEENYEPHQSEPHTPQCTTCIEPTPTLDDREDKNIGILVGDDPGPRYWLLTVLRAGETVPPNIELKLARLYRTAFSRHQKHHLGLLQTIPLVQRDIGKRMLVKSKVSPNNHPTSKKQVLNDIEELKENKHLDLHLLNYSAEETVQVRMQNTSVTESGSTRLIYSVHLGGKPVPAEIAAKDMALLSPQEVALELGAPVLIQSEPYIKESRPLALSRKRDAWLLVGAASAGFVLLAFVLAVLIFTTRKKRSHGAVTAPPNHGLLKKRQYYVPKLAGSSNTALSTPEMEIKTNDSEKHTLESVQRSPISPQTHDSFTGDIYKVSSEKDDETKRRMGEASTWEHSSKKRRLTHGKISRTNAIDVPRPSNSINTIDNSKTLESLETSYTRQEAIEEATASPHSYLSMPSCKQFPKLKSVEPLSKVLEPVMVNHLDIDSPDLPRRDNNDNDTGFSRSLSTTKDPGVVGPIVWNLQKQILSTEDTSETDDPNYMTSKTPVGRARRRLNELLEDSFSLFGTRDPKSEIQSCTPRPASAMYTPDVLTIFSKTKGRSSHISSASSPTMEIKSSLDTLLAEKHFEGNIMENSHSVPIQSHSTWGTRPLSAGPFHRPNLPSINKKSILLDCQLPQEDPAVPLIASIKKELKKFSSQ
ncbi:uncharacterized protein LOC128872433 [Hylaeus volcanicus]|uniref:uncharacterized protein LOC128872433 n=1 Tax=Hylaeus volcanicus TaxID=313075 RepID=UPI0023B7FACB|nr:uncharacterized protein LOC128872433 [Hylaeus volcanicus]